MRAGDHGLLTVALATDGDVLTQSHGNGPAHESCRAGGEDGAGSVGGPGNTDYDGGHGDNAVIGAEYAGSEPIQALCNFPVLESSRGRVSSCVRFISTS